MPSVLSKLPVMISDEDVIDPRYQNGMVYILKHKTKAHLDTYIGSTINYRIRYNYHKSSYNRFPDAKLYKYIYENDGWENWVMEKLLDYPCNNKRLLELKEDEIMLKYESKLNSFRAYHCVKDSNKNAYIKNRDVRLKQAIAYRANNREKAILYQVEHRKINKYKIAEKRKEKITCNICGCETNKKHLSRHQRTKKCSSFS